MFQKLKVISPSSDKNTRFTSATDWKFAAGLPAVQVTRDEARALSDEYVIVFTNTTPIYPMALMGLDDNNCYITADGEWAASQIPSRLQAYPFSSITVDGKAELVRASDAPHFKDGGGRPLYDEQGKPTDVLELAIDATVTVHLGLQAASRLAERLDAAGLLMDSDIKISLGAGKERIINGFKAVRESALAALTEVSRAELTASGAMDLLAAHQHSLANLGRLVAPTGPAPAPAPKKTSKPKAAAAGKPAAEAKKPATPRKAAKAADDATTAPAKAKVAAKPRAQKMVK